MMVCPRCQVTFDISSEDIEAIFDDAGQTTGWRHKKCELRKDNNE